ncbi:unnamed protein product, partial [Larinioides sclopetarius]
MMYKTAEEVLKTNVILFIIKATLSAVVLTYGGAEILYNAGFIENGFERQSIASQMQRWLD